MPNTTRNKKSRTSGNNIVDVKDVKEKNLEMYGKDEEGIRKLGQFITKEYELLRLVLSYMPLRDLHSASQVCKSWKSAVDIIKRSRKPRSYWFLWHCRMKTHLKEELPYLMFSRHFFSEPQLCLMFMSRQLSNSEINCKRAKAPCPINKNGVRCNMKHRVVSYMRAELHECPCIVVEGYGVVGSSHDLSYTMEIEEVFNAYSSVLLPKAPGLTIKVFHLCKTDVVSLHARRTLVAKQVEAITGLDPSSDPIRCLLLFSKDIYSKDIDKLVDALEARQGSKFAVGGGFFDRINLGDLAPMNERRHICIVGVAFMGANVHAASTILGSDVVEEEQVVEAMDELRSCNLPAQESLGFMFACMGRGVEWYQEDNLESASFRHHFPSTPLFGFFGSGEIGRRYLPGTEKTKNPRPGQHTEGGSLIHSYTSIFVYLTFARQAPT